MTREDTFGEKSPLAEAHLTKVTKGKQIANDDGKDLIKFYYSLCDCIVAPHQLNYEFNIYSTDTLLQIVRRFPNKFYWGWG